MVGNPTQLKTVAHILTKSQDMHIFPKGREWQTFWSHLKYCSLSILGGGLEIPLRLKSKVPNISHTQRCRCSSLCYIHMNGEDKNSDEDNVDEEEKINFVTEDVIEVENKEPGETKLIKSKMKSKASVIDDHGT